MNYGQLPDAAPQKPYLAKSRVVCFSLSCQVLEIWGTSLIFLLRWSYLNCLLFPVGWWCTEGSKERCSWCSGSAVCATKQGVASPRWMCCYYWDVLSFGTQKHCLTGKIKGFKPNSDIAFSRYLHLWLLSFSWVGGDQRKKKSKKQKLKNTHKLEDAGVKKKKENKSAVKGLLGLTQDWHIIDDQEPEMFFLNRDFLSSKSFAQEMDVTPAPRQIEKIHWKTL